MTRAVNHRAEPRFEVTAHRKLDFEPDDGSAKKEVYLWVGKPVQTKSDWYCPFEVQGWQSRIIDAASGADSMQALLLAFAKLRICLMAQAMAHQGKLWFNGRPGTGLLGFGEESPNQEQEQEPAEPEVVPEVDEITEKT